MIPLARKRLGVGTECSLVFSGLFGSRASSRTCSQGRARDSYASEAWPPKGLHSRRSVSRQTASIEGQAASWDSPETRQRWAHDRAVGRKSVEVDATATGIFKRTYFNAGRARFAQAPSIGPQSQTKSG